MVRPKLSRTIESHPDINGFHPSGAGEREEIVLSLEEFEAVRLIDFEGLDQTQASGQMGISRQTFGRILKAARFIITKALVVGLQLKVTGGCYQVRGNGQGKRNGSGGQRRRQSMNNMEQQGNRGGTQMKNNRISQTQDSVNSNANANGGQGRGQGKGQGQGKGGGQGRGRGQGGGKGNGSCRQS